MPLVKREIEPVYLSRGLITPQGVTNELECVTNSTLSAIIRQLSNLGKHAEDIFGELYNEANLLYKRSNMLQDRIDRLTVKVTQLDATRDQDSLEAGQPSYHNTFQPDQIILDTGTLPPALKATRDRCSPVPPLGLLDQYRDDGKEALKFYTNPKYFFELWCQEMQKNITDIRERRRGKRRQRGNRTHQTSAPREIRTRREVWAQQAQGKDLMPVQSQENLTPTHTPTSDTPTHPMSDGDSSQGSMSNVNHHDEYGSQRHRPHNRPPPPPNQQSPAGHHRQMENGISRPSRKAPAPPPPGPDMYQNPQDTYHNQQDMYHNQQDMYNNQQDMYNNQQPDMYQNHQMPPAPQPIMQQQTHDPMEQFPLPPADHSMANNHIPMAPPPPPPMTGDYPNNQAPTPPPMPSDPNVPPPPPPPPPGAGLSLPGVPPPSANIPAPPPPPPVGGLAQPPKSSTPDTKMSSSPPSNPISPTRRTSQRPTPPRQQDERSDLLNAIVKGINLRKVEVKQEREKTAMPNSVEAILARRIAVELSDSEDGGSYDSESDDEEWGD